MCLGVADLAACLPPSLPTHHPDTALSADNRFLLYSSITPEVHLVSGPACLLSSWVSSGGQRCLPSLLLFQAAGSAAGCRCQPVAPNQTPAKRTQNEERGEVEVVESQSPNPPCLPTLLPGQHREQRRRGVGG